MSLEEQVYSILIVSAVENFNSSLRALLPDARFSPVRIEASVTSARQLLLERQYDFVIVNSPLPDDIGTRFAIDICSQKGSVALLLIKSELYTAVYNKVAEHGVYVLPKPTSRTVISQALDWMIATRERLRKLEKKSVSIEDKMQEIRLVNRAKWILIEQLKMTEEEAHRYIEKQAMDSCLSKKKIAESLIRTYGN